MVESSDTEDEAGTVAVECSEQTLLNDDSDDIYADDDGVSGPRLSDPRKTCSEAETVHNITRHCTT